MEPKEDTNEPVAYTRLELKRLQDAVAGNMTQAEAIRMKYQGRSEDMSGQEETEYVRLVDEAHGYKSKIVAAQKYLSLKNWADNAQLALGVGGPSGAPVSDVEKQATQHAKLYRDYLRGQSKQSQHNLERFLGERTAPDKKAYQSDNPEGGGFSVMPQQMVSEFITLMKDLVFMREAATIFTVPNAESLGVPAIDVDPSDSDWTTELKVGNEEQTASYGKREFRPHPLAKYIKESKKLLRQVPNTENVLLDRLGYKMSITQEKAYIVGDGADKPLGVYTASANGISTNRDVISLGSNAIVGDDVINTFYNLKAPYRAKASWLLGRQIVLAVRKLKDGNQNYLWTAGYGNPTGAPSGPGGGLQGTPDTLMGRPIWESEYCPTTVTTGLYTMLCGDFSRYWIADSLEMQMQVLYELFALSNQMGFILRVETDGMPVLEEAFSRLRQL